MEYGDIIMYTDGNLRILYIDIDSKIENYIKRHLTNLIIYSLLHILGQQKGHWCRTTKEEQRIKFMVEKKLKNKNKKVEKKKKHRRKDGNLRVPLKSFRNLT